MGTNSDSESDESEVQAKEARNPEFETFWNTWSQDIIKKILSDLDSRAKYMITTSATLLAVNFGILLVLKFTSVSIVIGPPFFFLLSAAFFVTSFFPVTREINIQAPYESHKAFERWRQWKIKWQKLGFIFFLIGLGVMAVAAAFHIVAVEYSGLSVR